MNINSSLLRLIKESYDPTIGKLIGKYKELIEKLSNCKNDLNLIKSIFPLNIEFMQNKEIQTNFTYLQSASRYVGIKTEIDNEIKNYINECINIINKEYQYYLDQNNKYNMLIDSIENGNNPEIIFDFIQNCYFNKKISINEAIEFNTFIALNSNNNQLETKTSETSNKKNYNVLIEENEHPEEINKQLEELFKKYNYPYNEKIFKSKGIVQMKKFAKIDNARKVLEFFQKYNIKQNDFCDHNIKAIINIIIFYDQDAIDGISKFLEYNSCTLSTLLEFPSIFFKGKNDYAFKIHHRNKKVLSKTNGSIIKPPGSFENFFKNLELLKNSGRIILNDENKITDYSFAIHKDGDGFKEFLQESNERITKNLELMRKYGIISENKLPNALMAAQGSHVEYVLDRFVEAGLFNILKENNYYMHKFLYTKFRWYKIKLAMILGEKITPSRGKGLSKSLTDEDKIFHGMSRSTEKGYIDNIYQDEVINYIPDEIFAKLRNLPYSHKIVFRSDNLSVAKHRLYDHYLKLHEKSVDDIFNILYNNQNDNAEIEESKILSAKITKAFVQDYQKNIINPETENDKYFKMIENATFNGRNIKVDNNTYEISNSENNYSLGFSIKISRQKVIRLCSLLKQNNCWINDEMSEKEKTAVIMTVLLKDSIITNYEYGIIRNTVKQWVSSFGQMSMSEGERSRGI